jgi:hypothetical protein
MAHDLEQTKIFDVNGSKYRVGLDEHGYVQIQAGETYVHPETNEPMFDAYEAKGDNAHWPQLDPETALAVSEYIEELAE